MAEQMKPSGIDWIGDIPYSWNVKRIKYLAQLKGRIGWQGLTSDEYTDIGPYLITGVDFFNGGINWENCVHITEKRWAEAPEIHIKNGDLLITKDGTVGKVAIVDNLPEKASLNSGVLLIKTSDEYNKKFLYWVLLSEEFWTWFRFKNAGNSTIVHLYQNDFAEFSYTFPNITEQQAIADFLDKECAQIDSIAADLEKQIELLQEYKKSLITETVIKGLDKSVPMKDSGVEWISTIPKTWSIDRLGSASNLKNGYVGPTKDILVNEGKPYIQSLHVKNGKIVFNNDFYVTAEWGKYHPKIAKGDILLVQTGEIGQIALVDEKYDGCNCHALIICSPDATRIYSAYLLYYLMSAVGNSQLMIYETGTTLKHLNSTKIKNVKVIIPPLEIQKNISKYLDEKTNYIDSIIRTKYKQIYTINSHKKSLIYEYVTGKKRVKEAQ